MVLNTFHLFAGAGGGIIADQLLGHRVIGAVEIEAYPRKVLLAMQLDGSLPRFPIWDDVTTFRSDNPACASYIARLRALRNLCICGGFPCQDISSAGKGAGITGARSGLWSEFARIVGEVMPQYVFVENSPMLTIRGLGTVLRDLAALGFDAEWGVLSAADVGAPHQRERIWILATNASSKRCNKWGNNWKKRFFLYNLNRDAEKSKSKGYKRKCWSCSFSSDVAYATQLQCNGSTIHREHSKGEVSELGNGSRKVYEIPNASSLRQSGQGESIKQCGETQDRDWQASVIKSISVRSQWSIEPQLGRVANGVAYRVDRLKAIGNGQVPLCAATAFNLLRERLEA